MKKELEDELFKKYPKLFPGGRKVNPRKNLMCFGFSHGNGWYNILDKLFEDISTLLGDKYEINMIQIKEKFGALRIYFDYITCDDKIRYSIHDLVCKAENESSEICEVCGEKGSYENRNGWMSTLCDKHLERNEEWDG